MGTASGMIAQMRKWLGTGEHPPGSNHNEITVRYNKEVDKIGDGPWCDMTITIAGIDSGNSKVVGEFAYTPSHANWFVKQGTWHYGTKGIKPGAVVFFDWSGSRSIGNIDHVGNVESVNRDGTFDTIEGNSGDKCVRKVRDSTYVVGYGMPHYTQPALRAPDGDPVLKLGSRGAETTMLQRCLNEIVHTGLVTDGDFGPLTRDATKEFQSGRKDASGKRLLADGEYGKKTAEAMEAALAAKKAAGK